MKQPIHILPASFKGRLNAINPRGVVVILTGLVLIISPFIFPALWSLVLFFIGWSMLGVGIIIIMRSRPQLHRWCYRQAYAVVLRQSPAGGLYDYHRYDPNIEGGDPSLPDDVRPWGSRMDYIMPLKGWYPGGRYDSRRTRIWRAIWPKRTGILIYDSERGEPITHGSAETTYTAVSPDLLQKLFESRLAANFAKSLDRRATTGRIWIYAIIGIVVLGVILKVTGAF